LSERVFVCRSCGNTKDRDTHSAINILNEGLKILRAMGSPEHAKTPAEPLTPTDAASWGISKSVALKQEATALQGVVAHDQVLVFAWNRKTGTQHVTTWGRSAEDCDQIAQGGNHVKHELLGWPQSKACAEPHRVKLLKARIKELERA
jgi:hypothetical protein